MTNQAVQKSSFLLDHYKAARAWIEQTSFSAEVKWQEEASQLRITESAFLREYAWVVLNSGFRESVVRKHFNYISLAFCDWSSAREISACAEGCLAAARIVFSNQQKLGAIIHTARLLDQLSFDKFADRIRGEGINFLESLPFIGQITCWHLAKNIGLNVAKPDRHLCRLADRFGYRDVQLMCSEISSVTGESLGVIDLVLWRYAVESNKRTGQLDQHRGFFAVAA